MVNIRKLVTIVEEILTDGGRPARRPVPVYATSAWIAGGVSPGRRKMMGASTSGWMVTSTSASGTLAPPPVRRQLTTTYSSGRPERFRKRRT